MNVPPQTMAPSREGAVVPSARPGPGVRLAVLAAVAYAAASFWALRGYWFNAWLVDDDARMHLLPFVAARQPEAFTDAFLVEYAEAYLPLGYKGVLATLATLAEPLVIAKVLGALLVLALWGAAFIAGRRLGGLACAAIALAFAVHAEFLILHTFGGLHRGFGFVLAMVWAAKRAGAQRPTDGLTSSAWLVAAMALFYPPVALVCGLALLIEVAPAWRGAFALPTRLLVSVAAAVVVSVLALGALADKPSSLGPVVTADEAATMPAWSRDGGRFKMFPLPSVGEELREGLGWSLQSESTSWALVPAIARANRRAGDPFALAFTLLLLPLAWQARDQRRWWLSWLAGAGIVYLAARVLFFQLGFPDRALKFTLPVLGVLLPALAWSGAGRLRPSWILPARIAVAVLCAGVLLAYPIGLTGAEPRSLDVSADRALLDAVAALPSNVLIVGWPDGPAENIPLLAGRELWVDHEHAHPIYRDYHAEIDARLESTLQLIFATSEAEAAALRDRTGLTHLVLTPRLYDPERNLPSIHQPFRDRAQALRDAADGQQLIFASPDPAWVLHDDGHAVLIDLAALRGGAEGGR